MRKEKKGKNFLHEPVYPGGKEKFDAFIAENLQYPEEARKNRIEGRVDLAYDVDHKGKVVDVRIQRGLGYGCDEEAIRVVKLLRFRVPKNRKVRVTFHKTVGINFRMQAAPQPQSEIRYQYIPEKEASQGYTIQINYPDGNENAS